MRIGIVRVAAIGDCVMASSVLGALRERYPEAYLTWIVKKKGKAVVRGLSQLDAVISWGSRKRLHQELVAFKVRLARFDAVLELHEDNATTAFILKASKAQRRIGGTRSSLVSQPYCTELLPEPNREHALLFYWRRAALLDIAADAPERFYPYVPITNEDREIAAQYLQSCGITPQHRLVLLNLGGTREEKRWPRARFAELACSLIASDSQVRVLVSGGLGDRPLLEEFSSEVERVLIARGDTSASERIVVAAGQLRLMQMAAAAERSALFVSGDTGPMHIAAAVGAPLLALFGPTDTRRTAPVYKPGNAPIHVIDAREATGLWPAPMETIEVADVLAEAQKFLNGTATPKGCYMPCASELANV